MKIQFKKKEILIFLFSVLLLTALAAGRYFYVSVQYPRVLEHVVLNRSILSKEYRSNDSEKVRKKIIVKARNYLLDTLSNQIFPAWYGTPWSFNGNAKNPLSGAIACGSFVENTLTDAGFIVNRRLSAQPSENIIKNLVNEKHIIRFSNISFDKFTERLDNFGEGIYIVGLDNHVGFIYCLNGKKRFVHSHGYLFVVSELPRFSLILRSSKYKVVGKLFGSAMIKMWLLQQKFPLKYDYFRSRPIRSSPTA